MDKEEHVINIGGAGVAYASTLVSRDCPVCGKPCVYAGIEAKKSEGVKRQTFAHRIRVSHAWGSKPTCALEKLCRGPWVDARGHKVKMKPEARG